ncbi:CST complex subunit STN1 isoform X2 [Narcine bancroftii]|uniref:CST complex subunit STN1 isoform X2 n=1 Tax=Narcine bancroftii TaxID=1343680 RepID=UPI003831BD99
MAQEGCRRGTEDPVPSMLWGLDPLHGVFVKLYVRDILELKKSQQVPGIFFYKTHPISKVDILGTVVQKQEKERFYTIGVDDGTGVVRCIFWKKQQLMEVPKPVKVADPIFTAQISRMLALPHLYQNFYDKTFQIPKTSVESNEDQSHILSLQSKIKQFLAQNQVKNFYQRELETIDMLSCVAQHGQQGVCGQDLGQSPAQELSSLQCASRQIHAAFQEAISALKMEGVIFQKVAGPNELYLVTDEEKQLHDVILSIIRDDSSRPKYVDKGCPFLHILSCVRHNYGAEITEATLQRVLDRLECSSDIISTMDRCYTAS